MMTDFIVPSINLLFDFILNKAIGVSLLLIVILSIRPFVLKVTNANIAYGLWLMIPLFILLPVDLFSNNTGSGIMTIILGKNALTPSLIIKEYLQNDLIKPLAVTVWLMGFMFMSLLFIIRFKKLSLSLKHYDTQKLSFNTEQENINIVSSSLINEPAVFGLLKANLILPKEFSQYSLNKQNMILRHELYHLSRHDHQINFVRIFMKCLFWFNPLIYFADKYCEADQEISCDQGVLKDDDPKQRQAYAQILIESVSAHPLKQPLKHRLLSQWKYQSLIKERVKMLKNISSKKWHKWVAVVFAVTTVWMANGVVMAEKSEVAEADVSKIATTFVMSRYPRKAAVEGIGGTVKIRFDIDKFGQPYNIEVLKSLPTGVFDKDALIAVNQWRFENNKGQKNLIYTMEYVVE